MGAEVTADLDATLEAAEDALLQRLAGAGGGRASAELDLAEIDILARLAPAELDLLRSHLTAGRLSARAR